MNTIELLIAGFGGQGVLFAGKFLVYLGMLCDMQVSWLPSYGPEMRGGTANCSVILSDAPVGSPIVSAPDCLIAMNLPSMEKYQGSVQPGGLLLYDSYLIQKEPQVQQVSVHALPATKLAADAGLPGLGNMVLAGKLLANRMPEGFALAEAALAKMVPAKKQALIPKNLDALALGRDWKA